MAEADHRRNWLFPIAVGAALVVLTVVALLREPVELDAGSPEGTVQAYLQAIADEDYERAHAQLSASLMEDCTVADIAAAGPYEGFTATLGDVEEAGSATLVSVSIRTNGDPGFGSTGYAFDPGPFSLEQESGRWAITVVTWPYFIYACAP